MKLSIRPERDIGANARFRRPAFAASGALCFSPVVAFALAACSVREAPVLTAQTGAVSARDTVALMLPEASQTSLLTLRSALSSSLGEAGYTLSEDGGVVMDFALSAAKAQDAFYASEAGANAPEPTPIVDVREKRFLDRCTAKRTRAKLVAYSRASGAMIASREAEAIGCEGDETPYAALATLLVDQLSD